MCARGVVCRSCPILQKVETAMVEARTANFPRDIEDSDIDAAKVWTCLGHMLTEHTDIHDGAWSTEEDRKRGPF